jgi:DNA-binding NarL/FixJ family response regulator
MICEDDPLLAADLAGLVADAGHDVCGVFGESVQALARAAELAPDLAIVDLNLSDGATGSEVARTLQAMGVRVVILSGYSNVGQGLGCVPHTFARKPVSREVVGQLLAIPVGQP